MKALSPSDLQFVLARVPKDVRKLMQDHGLYLGGGFIRETIAGGVPNDIDLFGPSASVLELAAKVLATSRGGKNFATQNAVTVLAPPRVPVQFIKRWLYDDGHKLVESFDFTVCQAAIWFASGWQSLIADEFYADLAARRLVYTAPKREEAAGGSMMRVRKFLARGYSIQATSLAGVIARVAGGVRDFQQLDEGQRAFVIAGLLHEVDPLLVVDGLEVANEHDEAQP